MPARSARAAARRVRWARLARPFSWRLGSGSRLEAYGGAHGSDAAVAASRLRLLPAIRPENERTADSVPNPPRTPSPFPSFATRMAVPNLMRVANGIGVATSPSGRFIRPTNTAVPAASAAQLATSALRSAALGGPCLGDFRGCHASWSRLGRAATAPVRRPSAIHSVPSGLRLTPVGSRGRRRCRSAACAVGSPGTRARTASPTDAARPFTSQSSRRTIPPCVAPGRPAGDRRSPRSSAIAPRRVGRAALRRSPNRRRRSPEWRNSTPVATRRRCASPGSGCPSSITVIVTFAGRHARSRGSSQRRPASSRMPRTRWSRLSPSTRTSSNSGAAPPVARSTPGRASLRRRHRAAPADSIVSCFCSSISMASSTAAARPCPASRTCFGVASRRATGSSTSRTTRAGIAPSIAPGWRNMGAPVTDDGVVSSARATALAIAARDPRPKLVDGLRRSGPRPGDDRPRARGGRPDAGRPRARTRTRWRSASISTSRTRA